MSKLFLFLAMLFLGVNCSVKQNNTSEVVRTFYRGFQTSDYDNVKMVLSDSITILEGSHTMKFSRESYHEHFKWDSVFQPRYELLNLQNREENPVATISVRSKRFAFLENNPLVSRQMFYLRNDKIYKIENVGFIDADWDMWTIKRDSLVSWIKVNHPEIDGFINDLTADGARNYIKAIDLYEASVIE